MQTRDPAAAGGANCRPRTCGSRARDFEGIRDHAIIRVFTEGVRHTELGLPRPELAQMSAQPVSVMKGIRGLAEAISERVSGGDAG